MQVNEDLRVKIVKWADVSPVSRELQFYLHLVLKTEDCWTWKRFWYCFLNDARTAITFWFHYRNHPRERETGCVFLVCVLFETICNSHKYLFFYYTHTHTFVYLCSNPSYIYISLKTTKEGPRYHFIIFFLCLFSFLAINCWECCFFFFFFF